MTEFEMCKRIDELEFELARRNRAKSLADRAYDNWIIGQAIAGLCANPSFLAAETNSEAELAGLVETACFIASYVAKCRGETS